jgi:flagellar biosynthesis GTPase FlhF
MNFEKKLILMFKFHISIIYDMSILDKPRYFSTTMRHLGQEEDKGKRKATKEDMEGWEREENARKERETHEKDWEEKEIGKAIQESKQSEKLNTNEKAGPSNSVAISDNKSYNNDGSTDIEYHYDKGVEDQSSYLRKYLNENFKSENSRDPRFVSELEIYVKAQEKELELVEDKLSNNNLSEAERRWHEGRHDTITGEIDDVTEIKDSIEAMLIEDQRRIAHLYDDEGLGKTPSPSSTQANEDSEDNNSSDPDNSGPSPNSGNPGPGEGGSGPNESGPTGEEGYNESCRTIIPFFILNFIAEIFEHFTNIFFF